MAFQRETRLVVDLPDGLTALRAKLINLSEGGCAIEINRRIDPHCAGRVQIEILGTSVWMPIVTRWATRDGLAWTIGCVFDRPTAQKLLLVQRLIRQRRQQSV